MKYTEKALSYIRNHREQPFFMWLSYAMPHVPLGASPGFHGRSGMGLYGDVITEIDWSVGQILETLKEEGMAGNTLVFFTSDNGPWLAYGDHAGSAGPLREGKSTLFEGGVRVPAVAWWPGAIPAGTFNRNPAMTIDLFPTFAELAGAELPERKIDGVSILPMWRDPLESSSQEAYYFFDMGNFPLFGELVGVRKGHWKLMLPYTFRSAIGASPGTGGEMGSLSNDSIRLSLFHLTEDAGEQINLAERYPEVVRELKELGVNFQEEIQAGQRGVDWITTDANWK